MSDFDYLLFDVLLSGSRQDGYSAHVIESPAGQARATFELPFTDEQLEIFVLRMAQSAHGKRATPLVAERQKATAIDFGQQLFEAVFDPEMRALLKSSRQAAEQAGQGVRIRLRLADAPSLANVPWEYMHPSKSDGFLALSTWTPVVRYLDLPSTVTPLTVDPPLAVLVMISNPKDHPLEVDTEWGKLQEATQPLRESNALTIERLESSDLVTLQHRLQRDDFHVFHYIGHGGFDPGLGGVLLLEDENRQTVHTSGDDLALVLGDHRSLRLSVLNSCEGARTSLEDPFAGVAQQLLAKGLPAVVAMQFEISDTAAIAFSREFYGSVSLGHPVDTAIGSARQALHSGGNYVEWATPVIYLRSPDGRIFDMTDQAAPRVPVDAPPPESPPPSRDIPESIEAVLAGAGHQVDVTVDDAEVAVAGVVNQPGDAAAIEQSVRVVLKTLGMPRMITLGLTVIADELAHRLDTAGYQPELRVESSEVVVSGLVSNSEDVVSIERIVEDALGTLGVDRQVTSNLSTAEAAVMASLDTAGYNLQVSATNTTVFVEGTVDTEADRATVERTVKTVLTTLGAPRTTEMRLDVGSKPVAPSRDADAAPSSAPPSEPQSSVRAPYPTGSAWGRWVPIIGGALVALVIAATFFLPGESGTPLNTQAPPTTMVPDVTASEVESALADIGFVDSKVGVSGSGFIVRVPDLGVFEVTTGGDANEVSAVINSASDRADAALIVVTIVETLAGPPAIQSIMAIDEEVANALARDGFVNVAVVVSDTTVALTGRVDRAGDRDTAAEVVDEVLRQLGVERSVEGVAGLVVVEDRLNAVLNDAVYASVGVIVESTQVRLVGTVNNQDDAAAATNLLDTVLRNIGDDRVVDTTDLLKVDESIQQAIVASGYAEVAVTVDEVQATVEVELETIEIPLELTGVLSSVLADLGVERDIVITFSGAPVVAIEQALDTVGVSVTSIEITPERIAIEGTVGTFDDIEAATRAAHDAIVALGFPQMLSIQIDSNTLPTTGIEVEVVALFGLLLLLVGFGLVRTAGRSATR